MSCLKQRKRNKNYDYKNVLPYHLANKEGNDATTDVSKKKCLTTGGIKDGSNKKLGLVRRIHV